MLAHPARREPTPKDLGHRPPAAELTAWTHPCPPQASSFSKVDSTLEEGHAAGTPPAGTALTDLVIITGFSGAGKSTAMAAFEDDGYFCVDNLPSEMIRSLVELFMHTGSKVAKAAVVSDVRGGSYFEGLTEILDGLRAAGVNHRVLFLEADEQALLTRYKETRRRHPLSPAGSVADGVAREGEILAPLRARADVVIDTTGLTAA